MDALRNLERVSTLPLQTFSEYKCLEAKNCSQDTLCSVDTDGVLLEYETFELRVNPPEVSINNDDFDDKTVLTIDSANRPGTLVEVVQCLTELGLNIERARISSDGGWFVDEFYISEAGGGKVLDGKKLAMMKKVLSVNYELDSDFALDGNPLATLVELSGPDRVGILAEMMELLTRQGCEVRSAAVWTVRKRVAVVLSATEDGTFIPEQKLQKLRSSLKEQLYPDSSDQVHVELSQVRGVVHFERRLHQLLLLDEERAWEKCCSVAGVCNSAVSHSNLDLDSMRVTKSADSVSSSGSIPSELLDLTSEESDCEFRSPKFSAAEVRIQECKMHKYWIVNIKCKDRHKLFFDTICTLSDLKYDVFHGSIDCEDGMAQQMYYCRQRCGDYRWDDLEVLKLKHMLQVSLQRRYPKGLKVHLHEMDTHVLATLTRTFRDAGFCITRAVVRPYSGKGGHTFHLLDADDQPPNKEHVVEVFQKLGGQPIGDIAEVRDDFLVSPPGGPCLLMNRAPNTNKGSFSFLFSSKYNFPCMTLSPSTSSSSSFA